jgi:hypothetical protein
MALQARVYEFLEQQDEKTLQGIATGTVRLAVLPTEVAPTSGAAVRHGDAHVSSRPVPADLTPAPSGDPVQLALDLSRMGSEQERLVHLNATGLRVAGLRKVAQLRGLVNYSKLRRAELVELLAGHDPDRAETAGAEPTPPETSSSTGAARPVGGHDARSSMSESNADVAAIASRLREIETEEEGAAYLREQNLDGAGLLAVASELQLTRVDRLRPTELEKRILQQAIGARRRFAGLRKW